MDVATKLLSVPIVDHFIDLVRHAETIATPYILPLEKQVTHYLRMYFPEQTAWATTWMANNQSPHATRLPLMNPFHVVLLVAAYLAVVFVGKFLMSFRSQRFEIKTFSLFHNLFCLALSAYMCSSIVLEAINQKYSLWMNPMDESENGFKMAKLVWLFYMSKVPEFVDTFIMVLKKNNRQISFLHLYHHGSIFVIWWLVTFWAPGGEAYYSAALNSFIHIVMYGYYFCTAVGIKQVAFIKKYITMMQMTQFITMLIQSCYNIYFTYDPALYPAFARYTPESQKKVYPFELQVMLFFYMQTMLALFANFFIQDRKRVAALRKAEKGNGKAANGKGKQKKL
ncbi:hypothetical protein HK102_004907 [Quaeritorhiza haematococci]|nr:hypothetical protein HK102_004907 [Quaeritorhiza haematococci]